MKPKMLKNIYIYIYKTQTGLLDLFAKYQKMW